MILRTFETRITGQIRKSIRGQNYLVPLKKSVILKDGSVQKLGRV